MNAAPKPATVAISADIIELYAVQLELADLLRLPSWSVSQACHYQALSDRREELVGTVRAARPETN